MPPLFCIKKTPPRQYEAGAKNTRNIREIYSDVIKPYETRLFYTKCRLQRTKSKGQITNLSIFGPSSTAASLAGRRFKNFREFRFFRKTMSKNINLFTQYTQNTRAQ